MRVEDDGGLGDLLRSDERRVCTGFWFTEGPVWIPFDNCLLFSDIPGSRIHRWRPGSDGAEAYRAPSRHSNGLTLDPAGNLLACEHSGRRVSRAPYRPRPPAGAELDSPRLPAEVGETVAERFEGRRLNSPNDVVVHSSGRIYFTDPPYGLQPMAADGHPPEGDPSAQRELDFQGVFRFDPDGSLTCVIRELETPNGLAFSPDESLLYVADDGDLVIRRYRVQSDGSLTGGGILVDMRNDGRRGVPDGMKVDEAGRIWTTGAGGVWVVEPDGRRLGVFELDSGEHAANLAFGGPDFSTLFLTADTSVYAVETAVRGIAPGSR